MKHRVFLIAACLALPGAALVSAEVAVSAGYSQARAEAVKSAVARQLPELLKTYKHLHAHPELSFQEFKTAALVAEALEKLGFEVTPGVGNTGVVAVFRNGDGPTVLIRGDMDALPVVEETGLPYASKVKIRQPDGTEAGAMHACGHDVHTSMLLGVGEVLRELRDLWSGTVVLIAQPAEEIGKGAKSMIEDGLFERAPRPDFCLSMHVKHNLPVGHLGYTSGWATANVDSVDITIFGKGGHGARPHDSVDPIVVAAHVITSLQTLVSRRLNPIEPGVVTVGSIHGGTKHNIIPGEVKLQLTVRSYSDEVRKLLLDGIAQITEDTCKVFGCPKPPVVQVVKDEYTPAAYNDPALTAAAVALFNQLVGEDKVKELPAEMGGEDFGRYSKHLGVPGLQFRVGSVPQERYEASLQPGGSQLPSLHSPIYAPEPEATLQLTVESMANLAMALLQAK